MHQGVSSLSGYGISPDIPEAYPDGCFLPRRFSFPSVFFFPDVIINSLSFYLDAMTIYLNKCTPLYPQKRSHGTT
jgi:hypothetical protein